jgi:hypothetical protein
MTMHALHAASALLLAFAALQLCAAAAVGCALLWLRRAA